MEGAAGAKEVARVAVWAVAEEVAREAATVAGRFCTHMPQILEVVSVEAVARAPGSAAAVTVTVVVATVTVGQAVGSAVEVTAAAGSETVGADSVVVGQAAGSETVGAGSVAVGEAMGSEAARAGAEAAEGVGDSGRDSKEALLETVEARRNCCQAVMGEGSSHSSR